MSKPKGQDVLQWVQLGMVLLPQLLNVISHYRDISKSGKLTETDKEKMKENLRDLKLPAWDDV